jgi:hypothetical protein
VIHATQLGNATQGLSERERFICSVSDRPFHLSVSERTTGIVMRIATEVTTTFAQRQRHEDCRVFIALDLLGVSRKSIAAALGRLEPMVSLWANSIKPIPPEDLQKLIQIGRDQCRAATELAQQFSAGTGADISRMLRDVRIAETVLDEVSK